VREYVDFTVFRLRRLNEGYIGKNYGYGVALMM